MRRFEVFRRPFGLFEGYELSYGERVTDASTLHDEPNRKR